MLTTCLVRRSDSTPLFQQGGFRSCLDFTRSSLYLNILLHVPSWKTNKCHSQTGNTSADRHSEPVAREKREICCYLLLCNFSSGQKPELQALCAQKKKIHKKRPPTTFGHFSKSLRNNMPKWKEKIRGIKKKEVGHSYGPSVEIRMFSASRRKKERKKKALRGAIVENVYMLSFCFCWYLPRKLWNCCFVWPHPLWERTIRHTSGPAGQITH